MIYKCVMANLVGMYIFLWTPPIDAPSEGSLERYKLNNKKNIEIDCFESFYLEIIDRIAWFITKRSDDLQTS